MDDSTPSGRPGPAALDAPAPGAGAFAAGGPLRRTLQNAGWLLSGKGVGGLFSLVYLGLAARSLGLHDFGEFALLLSFGQAIASLAQFQTAEVVIKFGAPHLAQSRLDRFGRILGYSAALDAVFEVLVRAGREAPMVKTLLVPPSWSETSALPDSHKALYAYCNAVMEPWDGPAALCATDGRWVIAGMDRNGLRPMRYTVTDEGLLIVGSETGMVPQPEARIVEKGRVGPGEMIAVDLKKGRFFHDQLIKDRLARARPWGEWRKNVVHIGRIVGEAVEPARQRGHDLALRFSGGAQRSFVARALGLDVGAPLLLTCALRRFAARAFGVHLLALALLKRTPFFLVARLFGLALAATAQLRLALGLLAAWALRQLHPSIFAQGGVYVVGVVLLGAAVASIQDFRRARSHNARAATR
mgnify:CR=1 FL=1